MPIPSMSDVTIGVVADMRRNPDAWRLYDQVGAQVVSYDDAIMGCTANHLKVWTKLLQHGGDWGVVLEDDAQPCLGFREQLDLVLADPPADVIGLYLGRNFPRAWQRFIKPCMATDAHWVMSSHLLHCVGVAIRMHMVPDMLRFVGRMTPTEKLWPIDEQITHWCRLRGLRVAYPKPSIVEHRDLPPLVDHSQIDGAGRKLPRVAWQFGTREYWDSKATTDIP